MSAHGLVARRLGHGFSGEAVLDGIDLALERGRTLAVLGPSGAGKTTLLHILGGLVEPDAGTIVRPFERPAFVFQEPLLLPWRTARGNVVFALSGLGLDRAESAARADALLARVGLAQAAEKYPHQLSGGMKKRVSLARTLAVEPDLLLLDEAFSALDAGLARDMQALVRRETEARGTTVVMVTHDLAEAVRLADEIVVLAGRPAGIAARAAIDRPAGLRDDGFVEAEIRRLAGLADIRAAFAPPRDGTVAGASPSPT